MKKWRVDEDKFEHYMKRFAVINENGLFLHVHRRTSGVFRYRYREDAQRKADQLNAGACCEKCGAKLK